MNEKIKSLFQSVYLLLFSLSFLLLAGFFALQDGIYYFTKVETEGRILKIDNHGTGNRPYEATVSYFNQFEDRTVVSTISVSKNYRKKIYPDKVVAIGYGKIYSDVVFFTDYNAPQLFVVCLEIAATIIFLIVCCFSLVMFRRVK